MIRILKYNSFNESRLDNLRKMRDDNTENNEIQKLKDYVNSTYTEEWFNSQLSDHVFDYVDEDDAADYDDDYEEAYKNLCMGGAIEYELLDEINNELEIKFPNLSEDEISEVTNDNLIDQCTWYDTFVFNRSGDKYQSAFDKMFGDVKGDLDDFTT